MDSKKLADLLSLLHANTFTEESSLPMLAKLRELTRSSVSFIIESPKSEHDPGNVIFSNENNDIGKLMGDFSHLITEDPFYQYISRFPLGSTVKLTNEVYKQVQTHPIADYYQQAGTRYLCGSLIKTNHSEIAFAIIRDKQHNDFEGRDQALLDILIPQIKIAAQNRHSYQFLNGRMQHLTRALEVSDLPVALIDAKQVLVFCTDSFHDYMLQHQLVASSIGKIQLRSHHQNLWLEQTLNKLIFYQNHCMQTLRLSDEPLTEMQLTMLEQHEGEPLFLLRLHTVSSIPKWWQYVYPLTPKELMLIDRLLEGLTLPEIAEKLQISHNTVRTHFQHILAKTGCRSQNQLLVTLLSPRSP